MTEKEQVAQMLQMAQHFVDKISKRKDCQTAHTILMRELTTIKLRCEGMGL